MENWEENILKTVHKEMLEEYKGMIDAIIESRHSDFSEKLTKVGKLKDNTLKIYQDIICDFI